MKRTAHLAALLATPVVIGLVLMVQPPVSLGAGLYALGEGSSYQEGCFEPCMCPILMNETLRGTFRLVPADSEGTAGVFEVVGVDWQFQRSGHEVAVTGGGVYTLLPPQHRLELDLQIGDQPVRHFDSGLVPLASGSGAICIEVSVNGFFCYDYAFAIAAHPAAVGTQPGTWGGVKGVYRP